MYQEIITFWFEEIDAKQRWIKDEAFDALINERFADTLRRAGQCELSTWRETAEGRLAEVIVLDQFPRNMYRDQPQSFAYDSLALVLAQSAVQGGHDAELTTDMKHFLYMPFMHSESLWVHEQAEPLFAGMNDASALEFERRHREIIERFGRYPHRNKILGRVSSPEEEAFLTQPGSSF